MRIGRHRLRELIGLGHPLLPGNPVRHWRSHNSFGIIIARRKVPHQDKEMWQVEVAWSHEPLPYEDNNAPRGWHDL